MNELQLSEDTQQAIAQFIPQNRKFVQPSFMNLSLIESLTNFIQEKEESLYFLFLIFGRPLKELGFLWK